MSEGEPQKAVLLTLGRLPVALDIARSFASAGWRVIVAEPFGMHLTRMSRSVSRCYRTRAPRDDRGGYLDDLRRIVTEERVSLIVPVSEESMHVAALHDSLAGVDVFSVSQPALLSLHDKLSFNRLAAGFGLSVPVSCGADAGECDAITTAGDYVLKPRLSCSGRGVRFVSKGTSVPSADDALVQQRIEGREVSSFSITRDGDVLCTVVYVARATSGSVAVVFERLTDLTQTQAIEQWVEIFVRRVGHTGFAAFDFLIDDDGQPFALECNPRATSGIHFIDTEDLAPAITGLASAPPRLRAETLLQEFYSSFTAALGSLRRPSERRERFSLLRAARDVSWSRSDPWPFLLMTINTWRLISLAIMKRRTFAEVAALDIEWTRD